MKRLGIIIYVILLASNYSLGQSKFKNSTFSSVISATCPYDDSIQIQKYEDWYLYQTLNNKWNGIEDSSICITMDFTGSIILDSLDLSKPLFLRYQPEDGPEIIELQANELYSVIATARTNLTSGLVDLNHSYPVDSVTRHSVVLRYPDSTGTDTLRTVFNYPLDTGFADYITKEQCVPTQKFDFNEIENVFFQINFNQADSLDSLDYLEFSQIEWNRELYTHGLFPSNINDYRSGNSYNLYEGENYLVLHRGGYPSANDIWYIDLEPNQTSSTPLDIYFNVKPYTHLSFQTFTEFRPSFVNGSDSTRHNLIFNNNGGDICLYWVIDMRIRNGNTFNHKDGQIHFGDNRSCIMFDSGSKLKIEDGAYLSIGASGQGMFALKPGMKLEMGNDASLGINNKIMLIKEYERQANVQLILREGNHLELKKQATIGFAGFSKPEDKLEIVLDGGTVDMSELAPEEQSKIEIKTLIRTPNLNETNFKIDQLFTSAHNVVYEITSDVDQVLTYNLFGIDGRTLETESLHVLKGKNLFQASTSDLKTGLYLVSFKEVGGRNITAKFMKR